MASPTVTPPSFQQRPRRSFAGPVVLILLGFVFLLSTMRVLEVHRLVIWFAHYWPVLLIVWGVIKLVEYYQAQRAGMRASGIGVGGFLLIAFLVLCGFAATGVSRVNWVALRDRIDIDDNNFPFFGHNYSYEDQLSQQFPAGASLRIDNPRGAVNITSSDDQQFKIMVHKRINAENQQDADNWNSRTKPQITTSGNVVVFNPNSAGASDHWVSSDLDISVPPKAAVVISTRRGDVSILGREGDVVVSTQRGAVAITDIKGKVSLTLDHSSARVSQVTGDVTIDGRGSVDEVSLDGIKGSVRLNGEFLESVRLAKIDKTVTFKSSRTELEMAKLNGDLSLDSGDLQASDLTGPVRLLTRSKDIHLDGISGDLRLQNENGAVEVHMSKLGSMQIQNRSGDIEVFVPDKAAFQLNAHARNGEVQSDFNEIKVSGENDDAVASGVVGAGGPNLVINNEHGTIEIRKGSMAMAQPPTPPRPPRPGRDPNDNSLEPTDN